MTTDSFADDSSRRYQAVRRESWDETARKLDGWRGAGGYYHQRLNEVYRFWVAPGQSVLEVGCGEGDLLAALRPQYGVGVDFSGEMIRRARQHHPDLTFHEMDAHDLALDHKFDVIILSDLVDDLWDVQTVFERIRDLCAPHTRVILNSYSRLWQAPLDAARGSSLATPRMQQNWLTTGDLKSLFTLADFEVMRVWQEIIAPVQIPAVTPLLNRVLVKLPLFRQLALTNFIVARPVPRAQLPDPEPTVSIIIAARNEAGNIQPLLDRTPQMGSATELVFVEGHSKDNTYDVIEQLTAGHTKHKTRLLRQTGIGKGNAVREGFDAATHDLFLILDADMTVPPEDLPRFYRAVATGKADFINGSRLVYPMEDEAMRFFNLLGNKAFGLAFSFLIGQTIKDTLCGTKGLWRKDYDRIAANRHYFGDFDPFGDYDLLLGAAKLNLKIVDLPVRYRARTYGTTNIHRWKHGLLLLRMTIFAARRLKFK